jgi:hypothetical protein
MKFDHQLKFNAAPEWKDYYINYARLKVRRERKKKSKGCARALSCFRPPASASTSPPVSLLYLPP